ncbi:MAG: hypothetical protein GEU81_08325 [Nitriliruptorales bacterium]|nr:hypothetical protein [Nitriliruptorales bacterium]
MWDCSSARGGTEATLRRKHRRRVLRRPSAQRARHPASITWADVAWLKTATQLPVMLKGIMDTEDAAMAVAQAWPALTVSCSAAYSGASSR